MSSPVRGVSGSWAKARRVALETEEWIPPQRPLSEEMTMKSLLPPVWSLAFSKTSEREYGQGYSIGVKVITHQRWPTRIACQPAWRAGPLRAWSRQSFSSTTSIHSLISSPSFQHSFPSRTRTLVIFSMFLTDFKRSSISRRVAMLRAWEGAAPDAWTRVAARTRLWRASMVSEEGNDEEKGVWAALCQQNRAHSAHAKHSSHGATTRGQLDLIR